MDVLLGDQMTAAVRGNIALGEGSLNILNPYLHKSTCFKSAEVVNMKQKKKKSLLWSPAA